MTHPSEEPAVETQFLLTESEGVLSGRLTRPESISMEPLRAQFPDLLNEIDFLKTSMEALAPVDQFGALVLRIDAPEAVATPDELLLALMREAARLCSEKNGLWGLLDNFQVALFLPHTGETACLELAEKLQAAFLEETGKTVTAGAAVYPSISYEKSAILENAAKAVVHAEFFGPGSRVPFDSVSLNISGDQHYQRGDIDAAMQELQLALTLDPQNVNAHNSLGVCHGISGDLEKALNAFETAITLDPGEIMPIYNAGYVHLLKNDHATALKYLHQAEQINPDVYELAFQTGRAYLQAHNPIAARPYLESATRLNANSCAAFRLLGECYHLLERLGDAVTAYKSALKLNSHDAATLSALGFLYEVQGQNADIALMFCAEGSRFDPENGLFRHRLARVYFNRGHLNEALEEFRKAHELGYDSADYIDRLTKQSGPAR